MRRGRDETTPKQETGMSETEGAGLREALTEFVSDIKRMHAGIETRMDKQEKTMSMIQRKAAAHARPALSAEPQDAPHRKAFDAYVRTGSDDALRGLEVEGKSLTTAAADNTGLLVDPQTSETVRGVLASTASIRGIATVVHVESTSFDVLVDHGSRGYGWSTETEASTGEDGAQVARIKIPLHELSAMPKASQRLLDDAAFDVEGWLAQRIAETFARAEAKAFIDGTGIDQPEGFLTGTPVPEEIWEWGQLGYVPTRQAAGFGSPDALIDLVYALDARYRANATFVMSSKTAAHVRKLKDAEGRFLWSDGLAAGEPARLLGYPVLIAEDMPEIGAGSFSVAFGDFAAGYTIAERPDLRILRDPFSRKPHVLFYATKRVGGGVTDYAAIKLLQASPPTERPPGRPRPRGARPTVRPPSGAGRARGSSGRGLAQSHPPEGRRGARVRHHPKIHRTGLQAEG